MLEVAAMSTRLYFASLLYGVALPKKAAPKGRMVFIL